MSKHIKREVVFDDDDYTPFWHDKETPTVEDLSKFVGLSDKKPGKRSYDIEHVTTTNLHAWKTRPVCLYIYIYSSSVSSAALFKLVTKHLLKPKEKDRSGAPSNLATLELANRLKEIHCQRYETSEINWQIWANDIMGKDAHEREQLVTDPPPPSLIHLFVHRRRNSVERSGSPIISLPISNTISNTFLTELSQFREKIDTAMRLHEELGDVLLALSEEYKALELRCDINQNLVSSMELASRPQETQSSAAFSNNVLDIDDLDHI